MKYLAHDLPALGHRCDHLDGSRARFQTYIYDTWKWAFKHSRRDQLQLEVLSEWVFLILLKEA